MTPAAFGRQLQEWRLSAQREDGTPPTQDDLAEALGKSRAHVATLEGGTARPPGKHDCQLIADCLGLDVDEVWQAAAPARMASYDSDLLAFHRDEVNRARDAQLTPVEEDLFDCLREIGARTKTEGSWVRMLKGFLWGLLEASPGVEHPNFGESFEQGRRTPWEGSLIGRFLKLLTIFDLAQARSHTRAQEILIDIAHIADALDEKEARYAQKT